MSGPATILIAAMTAAGVALTAVKLRASTGASSLLAVAGTSFVLGVVLGAARAGVRADAGEGVRADAGECVCVDDCASLADDLSQLKYRMGYGY